MPAFEIEIKDEFDVLKWRQTYKEARVGRTGFKAVALNFAQYAAHYAKLPHPYKLSAADAAVRWAADMADANVEKASFPLQCLTFEWQC